MRLYLELLTNGNRMYIWVAIVSIFLVAIMRFMCNRDGEDILSVILIVCLVFYFTYFARFERSLYFFGIIVSATRNVSICWETNFPYENIY